jgi:hypothetical protein
MENLIATSDHPIVRQLRNELRQRILRAIPRSSLSYIAQSAGKDNENLMSKAALCDWMLRNWSDCEEGVFSYLERAKD